MAEGLLPGEMQVQPVSLSQQQMQEMAASTAVRLAAEAAGRGERVGSLQHHRRTAPFIRIASGQVQFPR